MNASRARPGIGWRPALALGLLALCGLLAFALRESSHAAHAESRLSQTGDAANPCLRRPTALRCPDLVMSPPRDLRLDRTVWPGHVVLRATSSIDSVGDGPMIIEGRRIGRHTMSVRQRIAYRGSGGKSALFATPGRLEFKLIPRQGPFWKFRDAARFELWTMGPERRRVKVGPKLIYCFRDYERTRPSSQSPRWRVFPACSQKRGRERVRLGTSVGWSDVYRAGYHEQWINVTGLRGCYALWHLADPKNHLFEKNERNNASRTVLRLPFRGRAGRC